MSEVRTRLSVAYLLLVQSVFDPCPDNISYLLSTGITATLLLKVEALRRAVGSATRGWNFCGVHSVTKVETSGLNESSPVDFITSLTNKVECDSLCS